jgi:hypothetical protein
MMSDEWLSGNFVEEKQRGVLERLDDLDDLDDLEAREVGARVERVSVGE